MEINQKNIRPLYWFGTAYLLINVFILLVLSILSVQSNVTDSLTSKSMILAIPAAGIVSGYWLRLNWVSWWKIILIAASFFISLSIIFTSFFISPKLAKLKHDKHTQNLKINKDSKNSEKIFEALYTGDIQTAYAQLEAGLDINVKNDTGQTLLHVAQHPNIIRKLILAGANINAMDANGHPPIFNKDTDGLKILVDAGADIHIESLKGKNTALIWFSYSGYLEGIQYLVSMGADINVVNLDGNTALDIAQHFGHPELEAYLKSIGAKSGEIIKSAFKKSCEKFILTQNVCVRGAATTRRYRDCGDM